MESSRKKFPKKKVYLAPILIVQEDECKFTNEVEDWVKRWQEVGLEVEIQYSCKGDKFTALLLCY